MASSTSTSNPPPYCADTSIPIFLHNGIAQLLQDNPFYKLVEEARQGFISSSDILQYMARSTFVDDPTPALQVARECDIRDFLRYSCPVVVGRKPASTTDGGHSYEKLSSDEKVMGRAHVYLDQDMVDRWAEKKCPQGRKLLLGFLFKLILLHEFTIAAWSIYGYGEKKPDSGSEDVRSSTPFAPHQPDVWVSQCGHVFVSYRRGKTRDPQSVVFLNDEGGYIDIPPVDSPVLRKLASGDWSVFQRDIITSIGPYRKSSKKDYLERVWPVTCECTGLGSGHVRV